MPAHLEPIVYVLRAGKLFLAPPDIPECCGTVTIDEDGVATIRGLAGRLEDRSVRDEIVAAVKAKGHAVVKWRRRKKGKWIPRQA